MRPRQVPRQGTLPHIPLDLVLELDKRFPNRCAREGMSMSDIWMEAGARRVVEFLIHHAQKQHNVYLEARRVSITQPSEATSTGGGLSSATGSGPG